MPIMSSDGVRAGATITDIRRKRAKSSGDTRFTFSTGAKAAAGTRFEPAIASVVSLLGIQELSSEDRADGRAALARRGSDLLDRLDELRVELLAGVVPHDRLSMLADTLRKDIHPSGDERLDRIIGEIELRAQVEVAKLARRG